MSTNFIDETQNFNLAYKETHNDSIDGVNEATKVDNLRKHFIASGHINRSRTFYWASQTLFVNLAIG